jgi:uncharacterized protein involved in exopolysaccharide biosynthesis
LITATVLIAGLGATVAYFVTKKPVYQVDTRILTQRQTGPSSVRGGYDDLPTRSAWELVHQRENLVEIVRAAKLLPEEDAPRARPRANLSYYLGVLAGREVAIATEDPLDVLVAVLHKRLGVAVEDGTITISLIWPDPQQAYDVVQAALRNFLEARYVQEVRAADEVISVLQGRAAGLRAEYEAANDEAHRRAARKLPRAPLPRARAPSEELARLQANADAKLRALTDVEEFRRRRVSDLQAQLEQARNTLSDAHPKVVGLRKDIEVASRDTPQLETLREEEREARKAYLARLAKEQPSAPGGAVALPAIEVTSGTPEEEPRVRQLRMQAEQMSLRLSAAQLELDAARAAFKYRYNVIWPPQLPTEPVSPNPKKIFPAGILASIVLALLLAAAPDLVLGRICEPWQVDRVLRIPIVGRLHRR